MRTGAVTDDRPMTLHATAKLPTDQGRGIAPRRTPPPPWEIVRPPHWPVIEDMHRSKQRILFIAEAVTLAHVARLVGLARSLASDQYEICLACDPRYNDLIGDLPFPVVPVQRPGKPSEKASGSTPKINARDVITIGRKRRFTASKVA